MNDNCRLCLKPEARTDIFQNEGFLMNRIVLCCRLQPYADDGLPSVICTGCQISLDHIWNFQTLCHESDERLRKNLIVDVPVKIELQSPKHEFDESTQERIDIEEVKIEIGRSDTEQDRPATGQRKRKPEELKFECDYCRKKFRRKARVELHIFAKHLKTQPIKSAEEKKTKRKCEYCNKGFPNEYRLKSHVKAKHLVKSQDCSVCGKTIAARGMLNHLKHHLSQSEDAKPSSDVATPHRVRKPEKLNHECVYCKKRFRRKSRVELHIAAKHLKQREDCPVCGKYISPCGMANHMRFHQRDPQSKVRPPDYRLNPKYECNVCRQKFINQIGLVLHSQLKHQNEDGSNICPICNATVFVNDLVNHLRTHPDLLIK